MTDSLSAGTWHDVEQLYEQLRAAESASPGSPDALDLEQAIDRLLEGRHENDAPSYRRRNAVRRARYGRRRAVQQRAAAAIRLAPCPSVRTGPHLRNPQPVDGPAPDDPEQSAIDADTLARVVAGATRARHGASVLAGLLAEQPATQIAARTGLSRRTVVRCIGEIRHAARDATAAA